MFSLRFLRARDYQVFILHSPTSAMKRTYLSSQALCTCATAGTEDRFITRVLGDTCEWRSCHASSAVLLRKKKYLLRKRQLLFSDSTGRDPPWNSEGMAERLCPLKNWQTVILPLLPSLQSYFPLNQSRDYWTAGKQWEMLEQSSREPT